MYYNNSLNQWSTMWIRVASIYACTVQQRRYLHHTVATTMISLRKQFSYGNKDIPIETKISKDQCRCGTGL